MEAESQDAPDADGVHGNVEAVRDAHGAGDGELWPDEHGVAGGDDEPKGVEEIEHAEPEGRKAACGEPVGALRVALVPEDVGHVGDASEAAGDRLDGEDDAYEPVGGEPEAAKDGELVRPMDDAPEAEDGEPEPVDDDSNVGDDEAEAAGDEPEVVVGDEPEAVMVGEPEAVMVGELAVVDDVPDVVPDVVPGVVPGVVAGDVDD